ncbi:type VI secretion system baseplate subunit TssF/IglH [Cysteiniphilum litorale]|uniref:type VI secretion system baseplate subunit TssF/IglH n=1 Tax=Cysteiniphilum litorale TaxID=2056700 RepID=UPI003F8814ED
MGLARNNEIKRLSSELDEHVLELVKALSGMLDDMESKLHKSFSQQLQQQQEARLLASYPWFFKHRPLRILTKIMPAIGVKETLPLNKTDGFSLKHKEKTIQLHPIGDIEIHSFVLDKVAIERNELVLVFKSPHLADIPKYLSLDITDLQQIDENLKYSAHAANINEFMRLNHPYVSIAELKQTYIAQVYDAEFTNLHQYEAVRICFERPMWLNRLNISMVKDGEDTKSCQQFSLHFPNASVLLDQVPINQLTRLIHTNIAVLENKYNEYLPSFAVDCNRVDYPLSQTTKRSSYINQVLNIFDSEGSPVLQSYYDLHFNDGSDYILKLKGEYILAMGEESINEQARWQALVNYSDDIEIELKHYPHILIISQSIDANALAIELIQHSEFNAFAKKEIALLEALISLIDKPITIAEIMILLKHFYASVYIEYCVLELGKLPSELGWLELIKNLDSYSKKMQFPVLFRQTMMLFHQFICAFKPLLQG